MHDDIRVHECEGFAISVFVRDKQENVYRLVCRAKPSTVVFEKVIDWNIGLKDLKKIIYLYKYYFDYLKYTRMCCVYCMYTRNYTHSLQCSVCCLCQSFSRQYAEKYTTRIWRISLQTVLDYIKIGCSKITAPIFCPDTNVDNRVTFHSVFIYLHSCTPVYTRLGDYLKVYI